MRKNCIIFLLSIIITLTAFGFAVPQTPQTLHAEYLRMHVRADSNEAQAQAIKYTVKDGLIAYLTPFIAECETREEALSALNTRVQQLQTQAEKILRLHGYTYGAKVSVRQEYFPTRVYDGVTLPSGEYTALIVELGSGKGDNWWCVVYPPLCFTGTKNTVYKSKIVEIIRRWREK